MFRNAIDWLIHFETTRKEWMRCKYSWWWDHTFYNRKREKKRENRHTRRYFPPHKKIVLVTHRYIYAVSVNDRW